MIHPHHISTVICRPTMEIWTKPTSKNLRFPIMVLAAALASATVLIKPVSFLYVQYFTGELIPRLRDSFSGWMTAPYLFFLVNIIIIAILAMSRFQHTLDWTDHNHSHGRVKEISMPNERGNHFHGRVKETSLPNERGNHFHGRVKETSLPNERGDHFQGRVKEISLPNEPGGNFHGRVKEFSLPNERGDYFHGRVKAISSPDETEDHFHDRVNEISLPNETGYHFEGRVNEICLPKESGDNFHGRVKEIKLPIESGDQFHGRMKEISLPTERGDQFQGRLKQISLPNETGECDEEEEPEMCTKLGFSGVNGEDRMLSGGRFTSRRSKVKKMGQSLRVNHVEKDREETLESVWKKISEGRRPPLARHLRSGSSRLPKAEGTEDSALQMVLARGRSGGSTGQDELNKRVEAFIDKFNRDIKLQKQDSLLGYADMIHRGAM